MANTEKTGPKSDLGVPVNPSTHSGLKAGACSGLTLSGASRPQLKSRGPGAAEWVKIQAKEGSIVTETINITASGAYCKTEKPLPLLSKVVLTLLLPRGSDKKARQDQKIECRGTVVRTHPVIVDGRPQSYDVAIYFDELDPADSKVISNYIEKRAARQK